MAYEEENIWLQIKQIPLDLLHLNQWRLFNPRRPIPGGLIWNKFLNMINGGKTSREMLLGHFPGQPRMGPTGINSAPQEFRFAAHSIAIEETADGLFQRAINGTIKAGRGIDRFPEYWGFKGDGSEAQYNYKSGFIDLEIINRRWPPSPKSEALQGILLSSVIGVGLLQPLPDLVRLALTLLAQDAAKIPDALHKIVDDHRNALSHK